LFLESPHTRWIAVEPNQANIEYVRHWKWQSSVSTCTVGLSETGGPQTLYITNVDSGSSLLEPIIPASMSRRWRNLEYFFPVRRQQIETLTLPQALAGVAGELPIFIKLDTQGTELSILRGAERLLSARRVIGIEMEATLLAQPIMQGAGKLWQACEYLEGLGFELIHVKPIYGPSRHGSGRPRNLTFLNECDAVFALRPDIAATLTAAARALLLAFYMCNRLFEQALALLEEDRAVAEHLKERGCDLKRLAAAIRAMS
jgi:FkbM family methyltransferase